MVFWIWKMFLLFLSLQIWEQKITSKNATTTNHTIVHQQTKFFFPSDDPKTVLTEILSYIISNLWKYDSGCVKS